MWVAPLLVPTTPAPVDCLDVGGTSKANFVLSSMETGRRSRVRIHNVLPPSLKLLLYCT